MKMDNTINGRTPEEIKKGLECCSKDEDGCCCENCLYNLGELSFECIPMTQRDALAYIQQLERERDAAVEQLRKGGRACSTCKFSEDIPENNKICEECRLTGTKLLYSNWEWVGPQEVE